MRKKIEDLFTDDLVTLYDEWLDGKHNSYKFSQDSVDEFFMGYYDYLAEIAKEENPGLTGEQLEPLIETYHDRWNLFDYYWNLGDYSWFEYEPEWTDEEEQARCDYYNGI